LDGTPELRLFTVRRLIHPEDGSATWFFGGPNIRVLEDSAHLDALLGGLGAARCALRFKPPELRHDFECEFGPCRVDETAAHSPDGPL
jgi:hypothetical protein